VLRLRQGGPQRAHMSWLTVALMAWSCWAGFLAGYRAANLATEKSRALGKVFDRPPSRLS